MCAHLLLFEKNTIQKCPLFPIFTRSSLIHKNKPALVASIVLKKSTATVFVRFLKNTFNFTRSCALAQKAKFYALKMLKKQNLTHLKATKLVTLCITPIPPRIYALAVYALHNFDYIIVIKSIVTIMNHFLIPL